MSDLLIWGIVWVLSVAFYIYCVKRNALFWRNGFYSFDYKPTAKNQVTVLSVIACVFLAIPFYNLFVVFSILFFLLLDGKLHRIIPTNKISNFLHKGLF